MTRLMYKIYTSEIVLESDASDEDGSSSSRSDHDEEAEEFEDEDDVPVAIETNNGGEGQDLLFDGEQHLNPRRSRLLADLQALVAPIESAEDAPIAIPEPSGSGIVFFDTEPTRMGRRRRCRDMSGLSQCLCGVSVQQGDLGSIQCHRDGCETTWVSSCADFASSRLNLNRLSIIVSVSATRMQVRLQNSGLAMYVRSQRRHGGVTSRFVIPNQVSCL